MNRTIRLLGIDPAMRNTGLALAEIDVLTLEWKVIEIHLLQTEAATKKVKTVTRQSSLDLAAGKHLHDGLHAFLTKSGAVMATGEVPTGTQSARGSFSNGLCCGLLASVGVPLIEVSPKEVKMAAVGHQWAAKEEMIEWAAGRWPDLAWLRQTRNGKTFKKGDLMADNEHMADACGAVAAAVVTPQFKQAVQLMRAALPMAA